VDRRGGVQGEGGSGVGVRGGKGSVWTLCRQDKSLAFAGNRKTFPWSGLN